MTFTRSDLLVDMSDKELTGLTQSLVNQGDPDPIATTIAEQQARMERYIHVYVVDDDWQKTLLRALVLWRLCQRVGNVQEKRQKSYDATILQWGRGCEPADSCIHRPPFYSFPGLQWGRGCEPADSIP